MRRKLHPYRTRLASFFYNFIANSSPDIVLLFLLKEARNITYILSKKTNNLLCFELYKTHLLDRCYIGKNNKISHPMSLKTQIANNGLIKVDLNYDLCVIMTMPFLLQPYHSNELY